MSEVIYVDFRRAEIVRRKVHNIWDDLGQDPELDAAIRARMAQINAEIDETMRRLSDICPGK